VFIRPCAGGSDAQARVSLEKADSVMNAALRSFGCKARAERQGEPLEPLPPPAKPSRSLESRINWNTNRQN